MATADSNIRSRICVISRVKRIIPDDLAVWFPKRVISRWPATIFAISRTARVNGRITFLIDSIKTMKGIKAAGVLWGTRCANICFVWLIQPNIMNEIHRGSLRVRVKAMWLDAVNTYGNRPIKLLIKININKAIKGRVLPSDEVGPNNVLNSWNNFPTTKLIEITALLGIAQNIGVIINIIIVELIQLAEIKIEDEGSNTENRLVIIFNLYNLLSSFFYCI